MTICILAANVTGDSDGVASVDRPQGSMMKQTPVSVGFRFPSATDTDLLIPPHKTSPVNHPPSKSPVHVLSPNGIGTSPTTCLEDNTPRFVFPK